MENFDGLLSLFLASIEFTIILNLFYFSEKNDINKTSLALLFLLFFYQFIEFVICGLDIRTSLMAYLALFSVSFMPPLSLFISLKFLKINKIFALSIFIPALFFSIYYLFVVEQFAVTNCTVVYATYNYPLGFLYGLVYYLPILATILIFGYKSYINKIGGKANLSKILFLGYTITFIPGFIFTRVVPGMLEAVESVLCSFAFILFLFISYFVLKNKNQTNQI